LEIPVNRLFLIFLLISGVQFWSHSASSGSNPGNVSPDASVPKTDENSASLQHINATFLDGLRNLETGNPQKAIEVFSLILAMDPTLVRVRLELGRAYFAAKQWERARQEFFIALSGDLPEPVRQTILGFIRAIDARRGFDWDFSLGLTNAGSSRTYDSDSILLDFGGIVLPFKLNRNSDSQMGIRATGVASYRRPIGLAFGDSVAASGFVQGFFDITDAPNSTYDDYTFGARAGIRFTGTNTTYSIAPVYSQRHLAGRHYEDKAGLELAFESRTGFGFSVFGLTSLSNVNNKLADDRDGTLGLAQLGIRQSIGGRGSVGLSVFYESKRVDFNLDNYELFGARLSAVVDVPLGITLQPSIFFEKKDFSQPSPLFTANPNEKSLGASIRIVKNDVFIGNGFSPFVDLGYRRTKSDITAFSYSESNYEIGLERRF
jgi:surface lipoprotein assembly modifier-like protein/tetratricopeptide repeat protein